MIQFKNMAEILFTGQSKVNNLIYKYKDVTDEDKEQLFFIMNRYLCKKYPIQSQFFNMKSQDKCTAMDIWNLNIKKTNRVPAWFWKGARKKETPKIKGWELLYKKYEDELNINDILFLCQEYVSLVKTEIDELEKMNVERNK